MSKNEGRLYKYLNKLLPHSVSVARRNQRYRVPIIVRNDIAVESTNTHGESSHIIKRPNIQNVDRYRYDGRWYSYKYSVDHSEETFGILRIDDLPIRPLLERENKKSFIMRLDTAVSQGILSSMMIFVDHKFVNWDNIEIVYDCDDIWILLRGDKYNYWNLMNKDVYIVIFPFRCEYIGTEPDWLFNVNYKALTSWLQESSEVVNNSLVIHNPTIDSTHRYNGNMFNVGGWLYTQVKRYNNGTLSSSRVNKLKRMTVNKYTYDAYGNVISTQVNIYNALNPNILDTSIYNQIYYIDSEQHIDFTFDQNGYFIPGGTGSYKLIITDPKILHRSMTSSEDKLLLNLSDIDNLLFRENYLVFQDGIFMPEYPIMTSINNNTFCDNPNRHTISIQVLYHEDTDYVIRNSDAFMKSYMNEQARQYFEILYHTNYTKRNSVDAILLADGQEPSATTMVYNKMMRNIDAREMSNTSRPADTSNVVKLTPDGDSIEILKRDLVDAYDGTNKIFSGIDAYLMDTEVAFVPTFTDYVVFINDIENDAVEFIRKSIDPLDFDFTKDKLYSENIQDALSHIVEYNPLLLNGYYRTYIESRVFTGSQANSSLIYQFMYEDRRGLKIPRKRYGDHESYFMLFVNGELFSEYYRTIAYANFFFIPVEPSFQFNLTDRIEVLYFKDVNNNEIRFQLSDWLLDQFQTSSEDAKFYKASLFEPYIKPEEMNVFAHYPKDMLKYPTLITEPSEEIAFNVSYRDSQGNLCIKKDALTNIARESIRDTAKSTNTTLSSSMQNTLNSMSIDTYVNTLRNNTIIRNMGVNIFSRDPRNTRDALVATSKHKFIYQRLFVDCKSYRIKLDKRFRYCDNQRQYLLFINGRRMKQDSFLVTIPKHTRPFTNIYLYTARFVEPTDRIEIFYLPYNMTDLNIDNDPHIELKSNGYLEYNRNDLQVPLSKDLYLFFVNGKKIPNDDILNVDSHTIRVRINTNTIKYPAITVITDESIPEVQEYLHTEDTFSKYDLLIHYIKTHNVDSYAELDKLFGIYTQMTDGEPDKVWANVAKIAILNEIVRDAWVTSGYEYHKAPFVYDYETDELYERSNGKLILPAMDARPEINIKKNDTSLLYFYTEPTNLLFEMGNSAQQIKFFWEYSQRLNQSWHILSQHINDIKIPVNDREYTITREFTEHEDFLFKSNTGHNILQQKISLDFVNGIYWGVVDEDELQHYQMLNLVQYLEEVIAIIPKDNRELPFFDEIANMYNTPTKYARLREENYVVSDLMYKEIPNTETSFNGFWFGDDPLHPTPFWFREPDENADTFWFTDGVVNVDANQFIALLDNGGSVSNLYANYDRYNAELPIVNIDSNEMIATGMNDGSSNTTNLWYKYEEQDMYNLPVANAESEEMIAVLDTGERVNVFPWYLDAFRMPEETVRVNETGVSIHAITDEGLLIRDIFVENYAESFSNPHLIDISAEDFVAILDDGRVLRNMTYYYDPARRLNIRSYNNEEDLPKLISRLDKHLVREPNIKLNDYVIGNNNYFVFACPKRLVYNANGKYLANFFFQDINSPEIKSHCRDDKTTPVYTNGNFDSKTNLLIELDEIGMEYMGETKYTNQYGYAEFYMVWKSNGFFTRLFENYGIDIHIRIGDYSGSPVIYVNDIAKPIEINYVDGEEYHEEISDERTENMPEINTSTVSESAAANTIPTENTPSIQKSTGGIVSRMDEKQSNVTDAVQIGASNVSDARVKELLDQGIFLI